MCYSVQSRDRIFVKGFGNMVSNVGKNICKKLSGRYSEKLPGHTRQSTKEAYKTTPKWAIQKKSVIWLLIKLLIKPQ